MRTSRWFVLLATLTVLAWPRPSEAKGLPIPVHYGDTIVELSPVQEGMRTELVPEFQRAKVGYFYQNVGLFWIFDLWSWGGEYCLYQGDTYNPVSKEEAEIFAGHEVSKPWRYRFPLGLCMLAGLVGVGMIRSRSE